MVKRFLITTSLEETWHDDEPVLFLGEWCRRYSRKERWAKINAEVLPYHWDNRAKLFTDYQYLYEFYERLLGDLSVQLNQIHGVNHSLRYWRILIGPWLVSFISVLFDRWTSIQTANSQFDLSGTIIISGREKTLIPKDALDAHNLLTSDEGNHHLYGAILQQFTNVPCIKVEREDKVEREERGRLLSEIPVISWKTRARQILTSCYSWAANTLIRDQDPLLMLTYLKQRDQIKLSLRLKEIPQFWRPVPPIQADANKNQRQWVVSGESRSDFEVCARAMIPWQIPTIYLEGYERLVEQVKDLPWPKKPKMIWTSTAHFSDDIFKAWAAEKTECGSPLVIGQHGGFIGMGLWSVIESHEVAISDCYLSWGWSELSQPKIKPIGQLSAVEPMGVCHAAQPGALLVTCVRSRHNYYTHNLTMSNQWNEYFNDQCDFVENLPSHICDALIVRLCLDDYGWDQVARWRDKFPGINLDDGRRRIDKLVRRSRLCISTYNATTHLMSFNMNIPTVIFWNPEYWELRNSAVPYFEDLKRVGIFHENPESAAQHVAAIWDDVDAWWTSSAVREVVTSFKERYCRADNMLDRLEATLRSVMDEGLK